MIAANAAIGYTVRMAIQIFGTAKSFDTKNAARWFSARAIRVQQIDLREKPISKGELESVVTALARSLGGRGEAVNALIDGKSKEYASVAYLEDADKFGKLLENPLLLKTPIVRNTDPATCGGASAVTVGLQPEVWQRWTVS